MKMKRMGGRSVHFMNFSAIPFLFLRKQGNKATKALVIGSLSFDPKAVVTCIAAAVSDR